MEGFIKEILKFLKKGLDENLADRVRSLDALKFKPPSDTRLPFWSTTAQAPTRDQGYTIAARLFPQVRIEESVFFKGERVPTKEDRAQASDLDIVAVYSQPAQSAGNVFVETR